MNDDLIRKFCESRYRWPIVAGATLLLGLVVLLPAVDDYFNKSNSHTALADNLALARQTAQDLPRFEAAVGKLTEKLSELEERAFDEEELGAYRNLIIDIVRKTDCQVRRIDVGGVVARPWRENDHLVAKEGTPPAEGNTPFVLERRSVVLSVDGSMASIHQMLEQIDQENTLAHPHRLSVRSSGRNGTVVTVELELWLFTLKRLAA